MSFRSQIYATLIVRLPKHFQPLFTSLEPLLSTLTLATIFSVVVSVIAIGILCYPLLVKWQRDRLMAKQFPKSWLSIIESNLSIYKSLTSEQQKELLGYIQVFLKEKQFIGCLGLQIGLWTNLKQKMDERAIRGEKISDMRNRSTDDLGVRK